MDARTSPPTEWLAEGARFTIHPSEDVHWEVTRNGRPIGYLVYILGEERWSIRIPGNAHAGAAAGWGDWRDAVLALADYSGR